MEPFRYHVYLCTQEKPDPKAPSCTNRGSKEVLDELRAELGRTGLADEIHVTASGSLGLCERGPNMVVYPDGVWFGSAEGGRGRDRARALHEQPSGRAPREQGRGGA